MKAPLAEATGTALLLAAVVGSGIMGERLARSSGAHLNAAADLAHRANWWSWS